jgi:hypothetical protein
MIVLVDANFQGSDHVLGPRPTGAELKVDIKVLLASVAYPSCEVTID